MQGAEPNIAKLYRVGSLDQRVQILSPTEAAGGNGEITQIWGEYATRWANVQPLGGSEPVTGDMIMPFSRARFIMRYDSAITEKCRLVWNSHTFNVVSISVIPRNRFLDIIAESNTLSGSEGVDYGNYYATNSLKIRVVTGTYTGDTIDAAEITAAVGLTPVQAGVGYVCFGTFTQAYYPTINILIISNGTSWYTITMT